jgi:copper chaperone CopZ
MTCGKCVGRVERAICAVPGVESAKVDLASAEALVTGSASRDAIVHAVVQAGYGVEEAVEAYSGESRHDGVVMDIESYDDDDGDELAVQPADPTKLKAKLRQGVQKGLTKVANLKGLAGKSDCCGGRCERSLFYRALEPRHAAQPVALCEVGANALSPVTADVRIGTHESAAKTM